jgi:hypothetical protein
MTFSLGSSSFSPRSGSFTVPVTAQTNREAMYFQTTL